MVSVGSTLQLAPIALDDLSLMQHFSGASSARVWGFDQFGHLRPIKNLYFWCLARWPELLWCLRALNILAAASCAWLVRSLSLTLGALQLEAACAAALWLFNPTTVTGVAWLSASNYLFALLGALAYVLWLDRAIQAGATPRARTFAALAHGALLFAVLSHEFGMLTPLWMLFRLLRGGANKSSARLFAQGALAVFVVPAALRIFQSAPELKYRSGLPALQLIASAAHNLEHNLRLWIWPHGSFGVLLSQSSGLSPTLAIVSWSSALLCAWLLWKPSRRDTRVALALAWLLLFLLPLVNLVPLGNTPVAQHYLIIPGVGLAWLVMRALRALTPLPLMAASSLALLISWQPAFRESVSAYASTTSLYETTLANYPGNLEARVNLIAAYEQAGDSRKARELLQSSLQLAPGHPGLLKNQLAMFFKEQRFPDALAFLDQHAEQVHADPELSLRRGLVLLQLGRAREAEPVFQRIWSEHQGSELRLIAGFQLANLWAQQRRLPEAQTLLRSLHDEFPDNAEVSLALRLIDQALAP